MKLVHVDLENLLRFIGTVHGMDYRITGAVFKICGAAAKTKSGEEGNFVLSKLTQS